MLVKIIMLTEINCNLCGFDDFVLPSKEMVKQTYLIVKLVTKIKFELRVCFFTQKYLIVYLIYFISKCCYGFS